MDTIYSNKKYLQSLNSADYYRTGTLRPSVSKYFNFNLNLIFFFKINTFILTLMETYNENLLYKSRIIEWFKK